MNASRGAEDINDAHEKLGHIAKKQIRAMYKAVGRTLKGTMKLCEVWLTYKSKCKPISKTTKTRSTNLRERIFVDTTSLFATAIEGTKYWVQVVDNATRLGFCYFMKKKDEIGD